MNDVKIQNVLLRTRYTGCNTNFGTERWEKLIYDRTDRTDARASSAKTACNTLPRVAWKIVDFLFVSFEKTTTKKRHRLERHRLTSSLAVVADVSVVVGDGNDETMCQSSGKLTSIRKIKELFYCNMILKFCVNIPIIPNSSLKNILSC